MGARAMGRNDLEVARKAAAAAAEAAACAAAEVAAAEAAVFLPGAQCFYRSGRAAARGERGQTTASTHNSWQPSRPQQRRREGARSQQTSEPPNTSVPAQPCQDAARERCARWCRQVPRRRKKADPICAEADAAPLGDARAHAHPHPHTHTHTPNVSGGIGRAGAACAQGGEPLSSVVGLGTSRAARAVAFQKARRGPVAVCAPFAGRCRSAQKKAASAAWRSYATLRAHWETWLAQRACCHPGPGLRGTKTYKCLQTSLEV